MNEITQQAVDTPLKYTQKLIERSEKLRHPSAKAAKTGIMAGNVLCFFLVSSGLILLFSGKPLWALSTAAAGFLTLISHFISARSMKRKQEK